MGLFLAALICSSGCFFHRFVPSTKQQCHNCSNCMIHLKIQYKKIPYINSSIRCPLLFCVNFRVYLSNSIRKPIELWYELHHSRYYCFYFSSGCEKSISPLNYIFFNLSLIIFSHVLHSFTFNFLVSDCGSLIWNCWYPCIIYHLFVYVSIHLSIILICMYVSIYVWIYACIYTCIYLLSFTYLCICVFIM